ncbi:MAG: DUF4105 domain-containing protein [Gemmatimonadetes bacterium]|nr:DUF4105 domain-containing protein [Gemmatimonadota bacterium]
MHRIGRALPSALSVVGSLILVLAGPLLQPAAAQATSAGQAPLSGAPEAGRNLSAYLLTAEPGDRVWELFGHNGVLIRDESTGFEGVYHYGLFDMYSDGFVPRFLRGEMMYMSGVSELTWFLASYGAANRRVWAQRLDLTPAQLGELRRLLDESVAPENRTYRYDYFRNNCSTRIRDILDQVLGGELSAANDTVRGGDDPVTWRTHTRRLTAPLTGDGLLGYLGIQLLLGPKGDEATTVWQEAWVPMRLRDQVGALSLHRGGGPGVSLEASRAVWSESDREPPPSRPPTRAPWFLLAGLLMAGLFWAAARSAAGGSRPARLPGALLGATWGLLTGLLGLLFVAVHWTDHEFMYWNQNVLIFSPLGLALSVLLPLAHLRSASGPWLRRLTGATLGLAAIAAILWLIPWTRQGNGDWLLLALPVCGTLWWVAWRGLPPDAVSGVAE